MGGNILPRTPPAYIITWRLFMKCRECDKEITKENKKFINGGLNVNRICKPCYNLDMKERNRRRYKAIKDASRF